MNHLLIGENDDHVTVFACYGIAPERQSSPEPKS
jgi:hypothetical protein